jgi:hypothetical protein
VRARVGRAKHSRLRGANRSALEARSNGSGRTCASTSFAAASLALAVKHARCGVLSLGRLMKVRFGAFLSLVGSSV